MRVVKKRAVVFGGTGYLGSHVIIQLYQKGFQISLIEHPLLYDHKTLIGLSDLCEGKLKLFMTDWTDESALKRILCSENGIDVVVYAGSQYFENCIGESLLNSNIFHLDSALTVFSVLEKQLSVPVILLSSYKVYGRSKKMSLKEEFKLRKGKSDDIELNTLLEKFLLLSKDNLNVIIARLSSPIGAHCSLKIGPSSFLVFNDFHKKIHSSINNDKPFTLNYRRLKGKKHYRSTDLIHVVDAGEAIALIAENALLRNIRQIQVYNVSSNQAFEENKFAKALKFFSHGQFDIEDYEMSLDENLSVQLANNKLMAELGWYNKYPLIDAIKSHVNYLIVSSKKSNKAA